MKNIYFPDELIDGRRYGPPPMVTCPHCHAKLFAHLSKEIVERHQMVCVANSVNFVVRDLLEMVGAKERSELTENRLIPLIPHLVKAEENDEYSDSEEKDEFSDFDSEENDQYSIQNLVQIQPIIDEKTPALSELDFSNCFQPRHCVNNGASIRIKKESVYY